MLPCRCPNISDVSQPCNTIVTGDEAEHSKAPLVIVSCLFHLLWPERKVSADHVHGKNAKHHSHPPTPTAGEDVLKS